MDYELLSSLPFEVNNLIYSYLGKSKTAVIVNDHINNIDEPCAYCDKYTAERDKNNFCRYEYSDGDGNGLCEYCYSEEFLLADVYTCCECEEKSYEWTDFINREDGLLICEYCHVEEEDEEDEEEDE